MSKDIKPEFMTKNQLIERFNKRYSENKRRRFLDKIAVRNRKLVNKYILGQKKNPYFTPNDTRPITRNDNEYYALINWIIPQDNYKYKEVPWNEYCNDKNLFRSGVIPIVKINGLNYWLLANFHDYEGTDNPILSDFGGRCEDRDRNGICPAADCMLRELHEESKSLLTQKVKKSMEQGNLAILKGENYYRREPNIYFVFVELDYEKVKNINEEFKAKPWPKENFGSLGFYRQKDVKSGKYRTSKNLTDLLDYMERYGL